MKIGLLILKHTGGKLYFFQEILNFRHLNEITEKGRMTIEGRMINLSFFNIICSFYTISIKNYIIFSNKFTSLKKFLSAAYLDFLNLSSSFLSNVLSPKATLDGSNLSFSNAFFCFFKVLFFHRFFYIF